jgi:predicted dienelactone hydrolase
MILIFGIPVIAADMKVKTVTDFSVRGPLMVATLEFPNLVAVNRSGGEPAAARTRLFPRHANTLAVTERRIPIIVNRSGGEPAAARTRLFPRHANTLAVTERRIPIKVHIPATGGPFPIIIVSHGAGGNWDTHYAQAQHLASHGYAVLCLEHVGSNTDRLKSGIRLMHNLNKMIRDANEVLGRPRDVSFAIDRATEWNVSNADLRGRLDTKHVGVLGHSFGAYTTMVLCGMRPALNWLEPTVEPGKGLGPSLRDARVTCGVALSPQGADEPFFIAESFASLSLPLMGISGTEDKQQGGLPPMNRYKAFALWPEAKGQNKFVWLANAHHLDFTDSTGAKQQGIQSANREDVQLITRAATLMFFNIHLKGDTSAAADLTTSGMQKYLRGSVNSAEVRSR